MELAALECLNNRFLPFFSVAMNLIFFKLASWVSLNFGQIHPLTAECVALGCLENIP